jgi:transposase
MLKPQAIPEIPEQTAKIARVVFRKGNVYMKLREEFGVLYADADFAKLFSHTGQPGLPAWLLALVTVFQFMENLSDRQAADAVRARIDWKYALGLELDDVGFDFSVLSEFRSRLALESAEEVLLDRMLTHFKAKGLVKARGKQRTDSTHVLASVRIINRLELVGETLRAALNDLANEVPAWLQQLAPAEWYERYGRRVEDYRLPVAKEKREAYAVQVGVDGFALLDALDNSDLSAIPVEVKELPAVQMLRRVWEQQYERVNGKTLWRTADQLLPAKDRCHSPYDSEMTYSQKREYEWVGYKVHFTETCDADSPHLITDVQTTQAHVPDVKLTSKIHDALERKDLLPADHLLDEGYADADLQVNALSTQGIQIIGPLRTDRSWQTLAAQGFGLESFSVDWEKQQVTCPTGKIATRWSESTYKSRPIINVKFETKDCLSCEARSLCTKAVKSPRQLSLRPREQFEALKISRNNAHSQEWHSKYRQRAGIEGTLSQGVRSAGLRRSRYSGLAKTHLQHTATAAATNLHRAVVWLAGNKPQGTRVPAFAKLKPS